MESHKGTLVNYGQTVWQSRNTDGAVQMWRFGTRHDNICGVECHGFGTTWVQLRERKSGFLVPKRHQMKHLGFCILLFGTKGRYARCPVSGCRIGSRTKIESWFRLTEIPSIQF